MTFTCEVCCKIFPKSRHLRLHFARQHTDKKDWTDKCEKCGKVYADAEILKRHYKTHSQHKVPCSAKQKGETDDKSGSSNQTRCSKSESAQTDLKKKEYCCSDCDASFSKHHLLAQHTYVHTGVLPFKCGKCEKSFLSLAHRNRHEKVHDGYECAQCSAKFDTWSKLRHHISWSHPRVHRCTYCDKTFRMSCRLKEHLSVHQEDRKVFKCGECDRTFVKKSNLKTHIRVHHMKEKKFKCSAASCGKSFAYKHSLVKHLKVHSPDYVAPVRKGNRKKRVGLISRITGIKPCMNKVEISVAS